MVKKHNLETVLERRRHEPPHFLIAAKAVRKNHGCPPAAAQLHIVSDIDVNVHGIWTTDNFNQAPDVPQWLLPSLPSGWHTSFTANKLCIGSWKIERQVAFERIFCSPDATNQLPLVLF